jgi:mannose-6-phosphate isomerase-like protein (cupin superfamily)
LARLRVNEWTAREAGAEVIEEHDEARAGHEELYVVLSGHARFRLGKKEVDAPAGTLIAVAPQVTRVAHALEPGTTIRAIGAKRGTAFTPSAWEAKALANPS